jgi:hypothetical protein
MGWSACWIAVQAAKADILSALDLLETGEEVVPGERRAGLSCREFEDSWTVVFSEDREWASRNLAAELSALGRVLACRFEDKVEMASEAWEVRGGIQIWRVFHDNTASALRLDVEGDPPAALAEIRARLAREQEADEKDGAGVDYMHDAPLELAKSIFGYRADDEPSPFQALQPRSGPPLDARKPRLNLFARLLGGAKR